MPRPRHELIAMLNPAALLRLAGERSYARGVDYHAEGRVANPSEDQGVVTASVYGTCDYTVRLWAEGSLVHHFCSCPMGDDGLFCKHCVAVALEVTGREVGPTAAPEGAGRLLEGKVVLVTGGAGGRVGPGICRSLARHGATVAINCFTSLDKANALASSFAEQGWEAEVWPCDVRDTDSVAQMMEDIVATFGRIDGVVNNATNGGQWQGWDPADWSHFTDCFESEVKMALNTIHAARPFMREQGGGRIVNIVSEQWIRGSDGHTPYVTALGARIGLSRWLVHDLAADNITLNMVSPEATRDIRPQPKPDEEKSDYERSIPLGRIADSEEIGDACAFFISDLAKFVSGAYLPVGGGHHPRMGA